MIGKGIINKRNIKKISKKAYKNVPKKKLINKAATYGVKQLVGGYYLDMFHWIYKKTKRKALNYAGSYAYESFFRSEFAREKINTLPISIVALVARTIFNFLLFSRLKTGIELLDFLVSVMVTVGVTLLSPLFYSAINTYHDGFMFYTNIFVDNFLGPDGWGYLDNIKNIIFLVLGVGVIVVLQFVEINSRYLQVLVIHLLLTGFISDQLEKWIDSVIESRRKWVDMEEITEDIRSVPTYIVPVPLYKKVNRCNTKNIIIRGLKPLRAKIIRKEELKKYIHIEMDNIPVFLPATNDEEKVDLIENYVPDKYFSDNIPDTLTVGLDTIKPKKKKRLKFLKKLKKGLI